MSTPAAEVKMTRQQKKNKKKSIKNKEEKRNLLKENVLLKREVTHLKKKILRSQSRGGRVAMTSAVLRIPIPIPCYDGNITTSNNIVGAGRYGCVRLAKIAASNQLVAEKVLKENSSANDIKVEVTLMFLMSRNP